ncbi:MAG TPA: SMC-Scp complex subunit ScpB [Kiritimatiellia bacterium]|nr:SMC-Scp complex subunit ScpB [Kiritimatiellia bacterium]HRZ13275.1 SMC-Scp complex subunit ScpB [Kiritimatiellia bacterium]HSA18724.1 SMC-Scp complex subunit ScpB [Kiritimatiellia bacterium]
MSDVEILPELKEIIGAMLFVARQPLTLADLKRVMGQVAETQGGITKDYARASEADLAAALQQLKTDLVEKKVGLEINEVANGFRMENNALCGPWLRHLLEKGRPSRLSRPALETLAIIAYRQPCTRADIEKVRGVAVDQIIRNLLEMQLIRITGRSELPGRPWLFGTTQRFLEHFGLRDVDDLPSVQELRRLETEQIRKNAPAGAGAPPEEAGGGSEANAAGSEAPEGPADAGEPPAAEEELEEDEEEEYDEDEGEDEEDGEGDEEDAP